jgi:hypothetical protein
MGKQISGMLRASGARISKATFRSATRGVIRTRSWMASAGVYCAARRSRVPCRRRPKPSSSPRSASIGCSRPFGPTTTPFVGVGAGRLIAVGGVVDSSRDPSGAEPAWATQRVVAALPLPARARLFEPRTPRTQRPSADAAATPVGRAFTPVSASDRNLWRPLPGG